MYGFALLFLTFCAAADGAELPKDVIETKSLTFVIPIQVSAEGQKEIKTLRVFVSLDRGKTWKHFKDCKLNEKEFAFTAPRDDLYWFAVQLVRKDGKMEPSAMANLKPIIKVFVNSAQKAVQVDKSYAELQQEIQQLRDQILLLQKKIQALEATNNPK
jgi:hypothetical protein